MGNRYLKSENETLRRLYSSATPTEVMAELAGRNWASVSKYARHKLGLHRSRKAIGLAIVEGLEKAKRKREEKEEKIKKELIKKI